MLSDLDNFYLSKEEPAKSCLLALREIILNYNKDISAEWKYRMPFFCYKGKMFCYLWMNRKTRVPYLGIVNGNKIEHPDLIIEKRSRMKIMLFDPNKDLPVKKIQLILSKALQLSGKE